MPELSEMLLVADHGGWISIVLYAIPIIAVLAVIAVNSRRSRASSEGGEAGAEAAPASSPGAEREADGAGDPRR